MSVSFRSPGGWPETRSRRLESVSRMSRNVHPRPDLLDGRRGTSQCPLTSDLVATSVARPRLVSRSSHNSISRGRSWVF